MAEDGLTERLRWQLERETGLRAQMTERMENAEREVREGSLIYHCLGCGCFIRLPESDKCPCGRELHPVQFRAAHGVRFWPSGDESKLTAEAPVCGADIGDTGWCCSLPRGHNEDHDDPMGDDVEPVW